MISSKTTIVAFMIFLMVEAVPPIGRTKIPTFILVVPPNVKSRERRNTEDKPCCLVSTCKEISLQTENHSAYQCYKTMACGDMCKRRILKPWDIEKNIAK